MTMGPPLPRQAAATAAPAAAALFPRVDASFYAPPPAPTPRVASAEPGTEEEEEELYCGDDDAQTAYAASEAPTSPRMSAATQSDTAPAAAAEAPRGASRALETLKSAWGFASDATAEAFATAAARTRQLHARAARAARHAADPDARAAAVRRQAVQAGARLSPPKPRTTLASPRKAPPTTPAAQQRSPERARTGQRAALATPATMLNDSLKK
jgi:hypothetical protein